MASALVRAHDALAPTYDAQLERNPVAMWMRARLWEHYTRVFAPGARLLDFTAGTGADALFLAGRGARVVALDISPGMLAELEARAGTRALAVETRVLPAEHLSRLAGEPFDGALSGFAGINTVEDLPRLARDLARLVRPGGRVVLHALNSWCLWETVNALRRGRPPGPRAVATAIGGEFIAHRFLDPFDLYRSAFAPYFARRETYALSVIAAPPLIARLPRAAPLLFKLDRIIGRAVPGAGDFFVIDLEREKTW